jgi:GNAT superfamily N-acetyltransferase
MLLTGNPPNGIIRDHPRARKHGCAHSVTVALVREPPLDVREVTAADTAALRRAVLRGGRPVALLGDDEPAFHLGVYRAQLLLGTGNVRPEPAPWAPTEPGWRLRGMATADGERGAGVGRLVLDGLLDHCRNHGGGLLWCNARTPAQAF